MVNVEFLIVTYLVGLFVDWIFQLDWQATNKSKWGKNDDKVLSLLALITHSIVYAFGTTLFVNIIIDLKSTYNVIIMLLTLCISHAIIDTRIPVKAIMKFKGMSDEQINDYTNYGFMHIGIDHRLHELVIISLSLIIR